MRRLRLLGSLLLLLVAVVHVADIGGVRQPITEAYFAAVEWALGSILPAPTASSGVQP